MDGTVFNLNSGLPFGNGLIPANMISSQSLALMRLFPLPNFDDGARYNYQVALLDTTHTANLQKRLSKTEMAARMKTSRAAVDRLLDANNPSATLGTLAKAARALGKKLSIKLVPA